MSSKPKIDNRGRSALPALLVLFAAGLGGCSDIYYDRRETIALGADDPLLFGPRLAAQYELGRQVYGLADARLAELARMSVTGSAAPPAWARRARRSRSSGAIRETS